MANRIQNDRDSSIGRRINWHDVSEDYRYWITAVASSYGILSIFEIGIQIYHNTLTEPHIATDSAYIAILIVLMLAKSGSLIAIFLLIALLARRIMARPARWRVVTIVWVLIGLGAMSLAALGSEILQEIVNNDAFRRVTPDDFHELIGRGFAGDSEPLGILDDPRVMNDYNWRRMTLTEAAFICLIAFASGFALRLTASVSRYLAAVAVPVVVFVGLIAYCQLAAPWALIVDYDNFVGDRILGSVAHEFVFVIFPVDPVGAVVLLAYAVSMAAMIARWPLPAKKNPT